MLEIVNSKDGSLLHIAPHVYHTIRDRSGVPAPVISYNGIVTYVPAYTEKGPTGKLKVLEGSMGFAELLDTYGTPNVKKYGLPYSAAVAHAGLGGTVVMQSLKAPGAAHGAIVIMMKAKKSGAKQKLGWIFDASDNGLTQYDKPVPGTRTTKSIWIATDLIINENKDSVPEFKEQFIEDTTTKERAFTEDDFRGLFRKMPADATSPEYKEAEAYNKTVKAQVSKYIDRWKKVEVDPLQIEFEAVDIASKMEELYNKGKFPTKNGITSWEMLEMFVNSLGTGSVSQALKSIQGNSPTFEFSIPIIWGINTGKGKYGNNYIIKFTNTKGLSDGGRPLMECLIFDTKKNAVVKGSKRVVSMTADFTLNQPLLLDAVYSEPYFDGDFKFATAAPSSFDDMGLVIQEFLKKSFNAEDGYAIPFTNSVKNTELAKRAIVKPGTPTPTSYGVRGDKLIDAMKKQIKLLDEHDEDSSLHRLSNVDFTRVTDVVGFVNSGGIQDYQFNGGHEGELKYMKEFNWFFNFDDQKLIDKYGDDPEFQMYRQKYSTGTTSSHRYPLQEMFRDAFAGITNPEIYSLYANPCDYVIDYDYPYMVKQAMFNFGAAESGTPRDDVLMLFNAPTSVNQLEQAIDYKNNGLNFQGRNVYWYPGNFEWVDPYSSRSVRVPTTFAMIPNLLDHYKTGFDTAVAGVDRGAVQMVLPNTQKGYGNMTLVEKDKLQESGFNIISTYRNGRVYLDSQMANYALDQRTSLQEMHNNSIVNRILKECYLKLQRYKHMVTSDSAVKTIQEMINKDLEKFSSKVSSFSYKAGFDSAYDKAIGRITHSIDIQFYNTIKYHHVVLTALPIS